MPIPLILRIMYSTEPKTLRKRLKFCTLTGIDEGTPLDALYEMARRHPYVEFGVLYNHTLQGHGPFPTMGWISRLVETTRERPGLNLSLHVCASSVYRLLNQAGHVSEVAKDFPRIRLNLHSSAYPVKQVRELLDFYPDQTFITTHNHTSRDVWKALRAHRNHAVLLDTTIADKDSGKHWVSPFYPVSGADASVPLCGFAGGLSPENIRDRLVLINHLVGASDFWVDIDARLRNEHDQFDLSRAQRCLDAVELSMDAADCSPFKDEFLYVDSTSSEGAHKPTTTRHGLHERLAVHAAA